MSEERPPESLVLLVETVDVLLKTVARLNDTVRILHNRIERELQSRGADPAPYLAKLNEGSE